MRRCRAVIVSALALLTVLLLQPAVSGASTAAVPPGATVADARVAADVLMDSYDPVKAWWPSSWWNSAVAMQTIEDYMIRTGDRRYLGQVDNTFEKDKGVFPPGVLSGDPLLGDFTSRAIDDTEWWGLTWVTAYDLTGKQKYLDEAVIIANYVQDYWDPSTCGGGVWWNAEKTYKNSVTNGLYIRLTAELHNRIHGDRTWLQRSKTAWQWFTSSGLINSSGLVNDGLTDTCQNNGQTVWSYNQGLAIGAGLELWRADHDASILSTVRRLADAGTTAPALVSDGVLTESCDALDRTCDDNGKQFKGIFMRYLMDAADTLRDARYRNFVDRQAATISNNDRDAAGRLGERWSGATNADFPNARDWRTQASALSALIAAIPQPVPPRSLSASITPAQVLVMPSQASVVRQNVELGILATAPDPSPLSVTVRTEAPDGWTVTPQDAVTVLHPHGNADPARGSVPLSISVPAGTADGVYRVNATVSAPNNVPFRAAVEVTVAHTIDFDTGTDAEQPWLWDADGSQSSGPQNRFADGDHYFVYRFPFPADTTSGQVTLSIDNEFLVQASSDGQSWTTVLTESDQIHDGQNKADRSVDVTPFLGSAKTVYIRVADSFPDDGWGGRVYHVSGSYS
ncbi:MAG TPA: glycoside hydrolase family 76 protein [Mycobacteriales bacterium]|nr:glycoside hydrolase family 76 protein [Mycobacteriales bacterium]